MSVTVTVDGVVYTIPQTSETGWSNQVTAWIQKMSGLVPNPPTKDSNLFLNAAFTGAASTSDFVISLKTQAGVNPSSSDPIRLAFSSGAGNFYTESIGAPLSLTIPSGATLGLQNGDTDAYIFFGVQRVASGNMIGVVQGSRTRSTPLDESSLQSSLLLDTASDTEQTIYGFTAQSSKPIRWVGYFRLDIVTAGDYATATVSEIDLLGFPSTDIGASTSIPPGSITNTELAADCIALVNMQDNSVSTNEIVDGSVTATELASDSVTTVKILDSNVTANKLASDSVTTVKILDSNVTANKLASDSVTTVKILDSNVTANKLASNAVTTAKIADGNVTKAKLVALGQTIQTIPDWSDTNTGGFTTVTGSSITISSAAGRPIILMVVPINGVPFTYSTGSSIKVLGQMADPVADTFFSGSARVRLINERIDPFGAMTFLLETYGLVTAGLGGGGTASVGINTISQLTYIDATPAVGNNTYHLETIVNGSTNLSTFDIRIEGMTWMAWEL